MPSQRPIGGSYFCSYAIHAHDSWPGLSILVLRAYSRAFADINIQSGPRIPYSRILVLPLQIRFVQGFAILGDFTSRMRCFDMFAF
jgi:hypothetical protein